MDRPVTALLLLIAVIASAVWLVYVRQESRELFLQLERMSRQRDETIAEWSRLQIEQATFADASRIERLARQQLNMTTPETIEILVIPR